MHLLLPVKARSKEHERQHRADGKKPNEAFSQLPFHASKPSNLPVMAPAFHHIYTDVVEPLIRRFGGGGDCAEAEVAELVIAVFPKRYFKPID